MEQGNESHNKSRNDMTNTNLSDSGVAEAQKGLFDDWNIDDSMLDKTVPVTSQNDSNRLIFVFVF